MDIIKTSSCSITAPQEASNYDEILMRHSLNFADNLKELKNLSAQLYSAAEHFERSYSKEERKQLVVETAKDYVTNAIVNTVDHLGSVAYKVTNFLDENVDEFSGTELQFSCMEQRLRVCREFSDRIGVSRHSLLIKTPTCHKKYIIPDIQATRVEPKLPLFRKGHPSLQPSSHETFSFSKIVSDKELGWFKLDLFFHLKNFDAIILIDTWYRQLLRGSGKKNRFTTSHTTQAVRNSRWEFDDSNEFKC